MASKFLTEEMQKASELYDLMQKEAMINAHSEEDRAMLYRMMVISRQLLGDLIAHKYPGIKNYHISGNEIIED